MERLTKLIDGEWVILLDGDEEWQISVNPRMPYKKLTGSATNRFASYEDTGLTPREIMALIAENERLHQENFWLTSEREPAQGWIAMADKLPPEEGSYIVCTKFGAVCTAHFNVKTGRWGHSMYGVTHWMPLPKAPEKGR